MDVKQNLYELQMECFEVFKAQDPDTGDFDVVFEIGEKEIYAHRYRLNAISPTFKSMLSDRWSSNKNDAIKIKDYKFEEFKEFFIFIYSGSCNITDGNILTMLDMAEFYGVKVFKKVCDGYLSKMKLSNKNIFQLLEAAEKYSLPKSKSSLNMYINFNFANLIKSVEIQVIEKSVMQIIVQENQYTVGFDELFEGVYRWAKNKAMEKQYFDRTVVLNDKIKYFLTDILPLINFDKMNPRFFINVVADKPFLFSGNELKDILTRIRSRVYVHVTDPNGKAMNGFLDCYNTKEIVKVIRSQKNVFCRNYHWATKRPKPSGPCKLKDNFNVEWYLIFDCVGDLAIRRRRDIDDEEDYLLAEMYAQNGFQLGYGCKIETYSLD